ncbi:MAG: AI-2E family transporter [Ruminococcus sp.]|nr:AI-2E family transporter [Ruminococcus sp.]
MKISPNKRYNTVAFYAAIVIAINVVLVAALLKADTIMDFLDRCISVMSPITWGVVIAFLMNPIMVRVEKLVNRFIFKKAPKPKASRAIAVVSACLIFAGIIVGLVAVVVPELLKSVSEIIDNFSSYADTAQEWVMKLFKNNKQVEKALSDTINRFTKDFSTTLNELRPYINDVLSGAWDFINVIKNFVLGFIVSIYLLFSKETLFAQAKKILISICKRSTYTRLIRLFRKTNSIFSGFIGGKIIDSFIIGVLCYIGLRIMNMDYSLMISVIVGVTNIIPFFGPFIGAIPSGLFILLVQPNKFIALLIFIFALQQFDGNVLGPKILGNSTGLPGFWVLVALFVGGGLFGFAGMVLAVPVFALFYALVREGVENTLRKKNLPVDTSNYYGDDVENLYGRPKKAIPFTQEELESIVIPSIDEANEAKEG